MFDGKQPILIARALSVATGSHSHAHRMNFILNGVVVNGTDNRSR